MLEVTWHSLTNKEALLQWNIVMVTVKFEYLWHRLMFVHSNMVGRYSYRFLNGPTSTIKVHPNMNVITCYYQYFNKPLVCYLRYWAADAFKMMHLGTFLVWSSLVESLVKAASFFVKLFFTSWRHKYDVCAPFRSQERERDGDENRYTDRQTDRRFSFVFISKF